ncbi:MAG: hypothetical protein BMS9Abin05_2188 [Rhodothermia bacterium]|nr:MAG: hypothetical protein BMS9Abin05_2188 [Rhodothermia bacterium]
MKHVVTLFVLLVGFAFSKTALAQNEETLVLSSVQQFFDGMAAADSVASRALLMEGGQFHSVRQDPDGLFVRRSTFEEYLSDIASNANAFLERMWDPQVSVNGRLAVVTTPYDFHINGEFTHCGTDVFNLIKTDTGWRISSVMYTVERTGCPPSPLGDPKF